MQRSDFLPSGDKGAVLIVDDTHDDLRFAQHVISAMCPGICVHGVQSAEEMFSYLEGDHGYSDRVLYPYPMLILLDLSMPGMHGFEALKWMRSHPPHHAVPVVVLTVSGEMALAQRSYELGARSFLTKPLKSSDIKDTLSKFSDWPAARVQAAGTFTQA